MGDGRTRARRLRADWNSASCPRDGRTRASRLRTGR